MYTCSTKDQRGVKIGGFCYLGNIWTRLRLIARRQFSTYPPDRMKSLGQQRAPRLLTVKSLHYQAIFAGKNSANRSS